MKEGTPRMNGEQGMSPAMGLVDWESAHAATISGGGNCVEVAPGDGVVGFQDSKQEGMPDRTRLVVSTEAAAMFLADVKAGLHDL